MRQHLTCAVLLALAAPAAADKKDKVDRVPANQSGKMIDSKPFAGKVEVFKDDTGMYYVSPAPGVTDKDAESWVFYGDGKTMYQQRIVGSSTESDGRRDWMVWAPRVKKLQNAMLDLTAGGMTVTCTSEKTAKKHLTALTADEAKTFLAHAAFYPPLWHRSAHFLARDDNGVYYYVDELQEEYGGKGYRVFVGQKGVMKELAMTNIVADSAGEIFATKSGDLKIITGTDNTASWKKGDTKVALTVLDLHQNRYLIYRDLGIYGALGAVCDDQ